MRVPRILQRVKASQADVASKKQRVRNPGLVGPGIAKPKKKRADKLRALAGAFSVEEPQGGAVQQAPFEAKYEVHEQIGEGKQGVRVMRCTCRATAQTFAVKCVPKALLGRVYGDERPVMSLLRGCPNLISVHEVMDCPDALYYVMEYAPGGDLFEYIATHGALSEDAARAVFSGILAGLQHVHSHRHVLRDLKLENILLATTDASEMLSAHHVRLADFEFCTGSPAVGPVGSVAYAAPEALDGSLGQPYNEAVDLWATGVVLYAMLSASAPFDSAMGAADTACRIRLAQPGDTDFSDACWDVVSPAAKELIVALLHPNPAQRMTLDQALAHPWLNGTQLVQDGGDQVAAARPKFSLRLGWHTKAKRWSAKGSGGRPGGSEVHMLVDEQCQPALLTCPLEWDPALATRPRAQSL